MRSSSRRPTARRASAATTLTLTLTATLPLTLTLHPNPNPNLNPNPHRHPKPNPHPNEARFKEDTPRTRRRRAGLLPYASLEEGLLVCVDADREFVEGECERAVEGATDPCVWDDDGEMAKCVGSRGKISELDASLQGAKIGFEQVDDEWWFPFTVLSRAVDPPSSS